MYKNKFIRSIGQEDNRVCLHDCVITSIEVLDNSLNIYFDDGFFISDNFEEKTDKSKICIPIENHNSIECEKIRRCNILHHYFGIKTLSNIHVLENYVNKKYLVECIDEYYEHQIYWILSVSRLNMKTIEDFELKIVPKGPIEYYW